MATNTIDSVKADAQNIRQVLDNNKYEIDVFQREYRWQQKQLADLISDLVTRFQTSYPYSALANSYSLAQ
jgi:uncharacterized protein with ParB-like and HNH nuclease domain